MDFRYKRLPIFCYLCENIDHDERDYLQWIRSRDTLRPEEKQFGPWLRASQEKNQKPQLVMAEKQGENRSGEGGREVLERSLAGVAVSTLATASGHENLPVETMRVAASRVDVAKDVATPTHVCIKTPDSLHVLNFEQQLKEINDTINGSVSALNSVTTQEALLGKETNTQVTHVATLEQEKRMHANGPNAAIQAQPTMLEPQSTLQKPMQESKENLGLFQSGVSFSLGMPSPKQQKAQGVMKIKGGSQKKNKENRGVPGKENKSGSEETQLQGDKTNVDSTMEIEMVDMGTKRRVRAPLAELEDKEDNGKWIKREGEVKELGKLLAQHLGSAKAAMQPHRAQ